MILKLAGNKLWHISCGNPDARQIASSMAKAMRIQIWLQPSPALLNNHARRITLYSLDSGGTPSVLFPSDIARGNQNTCLQELPQKEARIEYSDCGWSWTLGFETTCVFAESGKGDDLAQQLLFLSVVIARQAEEDGGLLLHGALLEWKSEGIILAGPSGVGKSTACTRLPDSWQCLSDDKTLIATDECDRYFAHPWPTWSRFMFGGTGGSWDVQKTVPLRAIFILSQESVDQVKKLGAGHAVPLLVEVAKQGIWPIDDSMQLDHARTFRLRRFDTICALAKIIPCYHLKISRTGEFWREMERTLEQSHEAGNV